MTTQSASGQRHPLAGKRVLITRTREQASALAAMLQSLGAEPLQIPTIEIAPPESWSGLDAALDRVQEFDWVLFTSANAVRAFHERVAAVGGSSPPRRVAVIGPATAQEARACGFEVDCMPERFIAESLAKVLRPDAPGSRMLLVRAADARDALPETLAAAGACMTVVTAYRKIVPVASIEALREVWADPARRPHAITFTSSSTATNFFGLLEVAGLSLDPAMVLASIGPVTSQTLRELGHPAHIEAHEATVEALVEALTGSFV